jgi:hypothetical protein
MHGDRRKEARSNSTVGKLLHGELPQIWQNKNATGLKANRI